MPPKVDAPKLANTNNSSSRLEINDKTKFDADRATPKPLSKQGRSKTIVDYTSSAASRTKNITVNIPKHSKLILDKGYETITKKHNSNTTNPTRVLDDANHAMLSAPKKIDKDVSEGLNAFAATVGAGSVIWNAYCLCEARKEGNNLKAVLKEVENKVKELSISKDPEDIKTAEVLHASIEFIEKAKDKTMFEGAGAALSILATVLVVAGKFTKDVAPHVLSVGIFLACFKALINMGHSAKEVFELTDNLLISKKIDKIETKKAEESGKGVNLQSKKARMVQQKNIKQNMIYEGANVASWAMDAVGTMMLGLSSLSTIGVTSFFSLGAATPIVAPICIILSAVISITAENKAHKHSANVEDINELLENNPKLSKEDIEEKLIQLDSLKKIANEIIQTIKTDTPLAKTVEYHAAHYAINAINLATLQLLHTPLKNLQTKNKHNYARSFDVDPQTRIDTLIKTEHARGNLLEDTIKNLAVKPKNKQEELLQYLELLSKSSNAGYIMTLLSRDITHKERRLNPFNKKPKEINIKEQFTDTPLNHEGIKELRREIDNTKRESTAKDILSDLMKTVNTGETSGDEHQTILKLLHEKTDLFYRFLSKIELRHGTDILSEILTGMQKEELKEHKAEIKPEKQIVEKKEDSKQEAKSELPEPKLSEDFDTKLSLPNMEIKASDFSEVRKRLNLGDA